MANITNTNLLAALDALDAAKERWAQAGFDFKRDHEEYLRKLKAKTALPAHQLRRVLPNYQPPSQPITTTDSDMAESNSSPSKSASFNPSPSKSTSSAQPGKDTEELNWDKFESKAIKDFMAQQAPEELEYIRSSAKWKPEVDEDIEDDSELARAIEESRISAHWTGHDSGWDGASSSTAQPIRRFQGKGKRPDTSGDEELARRLQDEDDAAEEDRRVQLAQQKVWDEIDNFDGVNVTSPRASRATERDSWDPPPPVQKSPTRSTGTQTPTAAVSKSSVPNRSLLDSSPFAKPSAAYRSSVDSSESTGVLIEGLSPAKKSSAAADLSSLSGGDGLLSGEDGLGAGIAAAAASSSSAPMFAVVDAPIRPLRADERAKPPPRPRRPGSPLYMLGHPPPPVNYIPFSELMTDHVKYLETNAQSQASIVAELKKGQKTMTELQSLRHLNRLKKLARERVLHIDAEGSRLEAVLREQNKQGRQI